MNPRRPRISRVPNRRGSSGSARSPSTRHRTVRQQKKPPELPCRRWLLLRWRLRNAVRDVRSAQDASCRRTGERNRKPGVFDRPIPRPHGESVAAFDAEPLLAYDLRPPDRRPNNERFFNRSINPLHASAPATPSVFAESDSKKSAVRKLAGGRRSSTDLLPRRQPNLPWSAGAMTHRPLVRLLHRPTGRAAAAVLDTPRELSPATLQIGSLALRCAFQTHPSTRFPCGRERHSPQVLAQVRLP